MRIVKESVVDWWDRVEVVKTLEDKYFPHIPEKSILKYMPEEVVSVWSNWINGQTGLVCDDGDFGVYIWDWHRFTAGLERRKKDKF